MARRGARVCQCGAPGQPGALLQRCRQRASMAGKPAAIRRDDRPHDRSVRRLMETQSSSDLARTTFQLLALGALIASSFWIVRPFLVALAWATMIVVATWPLLLQAQAWLAGRRSLATALMTMFLLLILVVPLYFGITTIVGSAEVIVNWSKSLATLTVPQPPAWVETVPVIGAKLAARWQELVAAGPTEVSARLSPYVSALAIWFAGQVGSFGLLLLQFLLTVIIAAILYVNGETAARAAQRFAQRLAGPAGEKAVYLMAQAVRAVALGVVLTAILQSAFAGIGLIIVGVPFAAILTAAIFILTVAQLGAGLVMIPAVIWVYARSGAVWGT